ncbi:MAG: helix-turn-helix domain-containing protein [Gemmatimonadaceae bacterium]|nr:helix-turn-helix domain-containing protein [Gemmatimonadaceae bacterium]
MQNRQTLPEILTQLEVARFLRVSHKTISELRSRGQIRSFRVGGSVRFLRDDVLAMVEPPEPLPIATGANPK